MKSSVKQARPSIFLVLNILNKKIPLRNLKPLSFLLVLLIGNVSGQNPKFHDHFNVYSTKNGLSQNDVKSIFQDSFGFIWIGTHGGLNRFDGYSFKTYKKKVGSDKSIPSNLISAIAEDTYGNLWIGTDDEGIFMMERATGNVVSIKNSGLKPGRLTNNRVLSILIDKNNTTWISTTHGLNKMKYNYQTNVAFIEHLVASGDDPYSISDNYISCIFEDKYDNLWFGTNTGLNRYIKGESNENYRFIHYDSYPTGKVLGITSNDTSLVIACASELLALPFSEINKNDPGFTLVKQSSYNAIIADTRNNLWGGDLQGVHVTHLEGQRLKTYDFTNSWNNPHSLSKNIVSAIMEDNSGIIWIGTNGGGINLYNPNRKTFSHYQKNEAPRSLSYNKIRAIKEDHKQNLWIGTEGGGLNLLPYRNRDDYQNGFLYFDSNRVTGGKNDVYAIEEVNFKNSKKMFIGTGYHSFLEVIDMSDAGTFRQSIYNDLKPNAGVFSLLWDSDSILWVGTYGNGLFRVHFDTFGNYKESAHFVYDKHNETGISSNIIRSILEDRNGDLWFGTDEGINKLARDEKFRKSPVFINYKHDPGDMSSISYDYVLPIFESKKGDIWIGTLGGGLNRVIKGTAPGLDKFEWITTEDGLPDDVIKSIEEDGDGNLWIASNGGLSRYDPITRELTNYGINDGLQDIEFGELASTRRANGEMLFGGVNGFNVFVPSEIKADTIKANIVLTDLQILNRSIERGETVNGRVILKDNINNINTLHLKYNENSFSMEFAVLHYASPRKNKYAYKLEGFDDAWISATAHNRIAKYTNLSPGRYTLNVKASNGDGFWSDTPLTLDIVIAQPIWFTAPAIIFYAILSIIGLWFFRKYTLITNSRKNQLVIEHLEKEKIEELSQLKLKFFTNVSHEFRTPLTLILGLVERLRNPSNFSHDSEKTKYYDKIHRNSQVLLNLVNQLLDFRKIEQGKHVIRVIEGDIRLYIQNLCDNFNELARKKEIEYEFICENEIIAWYDKDIIERIVFNLLSNAFKFTNEEGKVTVVLEKDEDEGLLRLEVSDNGIGMSKEVQEHLFERFSGTYVKREHGSGIGLSYTKGLIELYHGCITFTSKLGKGTTFSLIFPYKKDAFVNDIILEGKDDAPMAVKDVNWILEPVNTKENHVVKETIKNGYFVLLVEDNQDILFFLNEHFKNVYNITTAKEGKEALDICLSSHIDLVISDIMMPGMDGLTFCKKLKSDDRINHIPVILLTAKNSLDNKLIGYEKGADAYIAKPFDMNELETRMKNLIQSKLRFLSKIRKNVDLSPSEVEVTSLDERFLKRVISYIEENIGFSEFTVEMLAKECGMSQFHLNKKLKVLVGKTANVLTRTIRLKRAAQLLAKKRYSVSEVVYEVGFTDAKYFRTCFKKEFGMSPIEYRRKHGNEKT